MIDQLAKEMFDSIQTSAQSLQGVKHFSEAQIKLVAESAMKKLNLVTREEFEVQEAVLQRSRKKIEQLETLVAELERKLDTFQDNTPGEP